MQGDRLHFNAVIGPRDGSTKWRSLKTWIKTKDHGMLASDGVASEGGKSDDSSNSVHSLNGSVHSNPVNNNYHQNHYPNHRHHSNTHLNSHGNAPSQIASQPQSSLMHIYSSNQSSTTNSNIEEDFNQYQLDVDFNDIDSQHADPTTASKTSTSINDLHQLSNSSTKLLTTHELDEFDDNLNHLSLSSSSSLPILTPNGQIPNAKTNAVKSNEQLSIQTAASNSVANGGTISITSDNISKREVSSTNSRLVHMGCQTVSTGDIMATNVYIA